MTGKILMFKIENMVNNLFSQFDHNNNGKIEYKKVTGKTETDESLREDDRLVSKGNNVYVHDKFIVSNKKLFTDADSNKDGFLTKKELTGFISKFDKNGNGQLDLRSFVDWIANDNKEQAEFKHFIRAYPEKDLGKKPVKL
jgi:Ca2+-binding EF-hand superfamily protein